MIVRGFQTHHLSIPLGRRMVNGNFAFDGLEHVLLELDVGDAVGIGHTFAFEPRQAESIRVMVIDLAETLIGRSIENVRGIWGELWQRISYIGHGGPPVMALATVDTAIWDLLAQQAGLPLYRLLGGVSDSLPVYATGGWLSCTHSELVEEARQFRERGAGDYKMKVGHADWRKDVRRVEHVRAAMDAGQRLMVDANQAWEVADALAAGRAFQDLGVVWLEEPVSAHDTTGCARVTAALRLSVATGESRFARHGLLPLLDERAADVLMPDVMRCGGPSEFLHVAAVADARRVPVSSHCFTEVSAHLMAACPNAGPVEWVPGWTEQLFEPALKIADGAIHLSSSAGLGFRFAERAIRDHGVDPAPRTSVLIP